MSFLLGVISKPALNECDTVEVNFDLKDNATNTKSRTVGSVPVQRNYRTNIYGNILSAGIDVTVTIKPEFDDDHMHEAK